MEKLYMYILKVCFEILSWNTGKNSVLHKKIPSPVLLRQKYVLQISKVTHSYLEYSVSISVLCNQGSVQWEKKVINSCS